MKPMPSILFNTRSYYLDESHMENLAHKWVTLQSDTNSSAFVEWFWVKQWLVQKNLTTNNCLCVEVKLEQDTVGLALFGIKTKRV
ncbi:MAG: hypothetical protein ACI9YH_002575, partial [Colwellia sp.]